MNLRTIESMVTISKWFAQISGTLYIVVIAGFILGQVELNYIVPETSNALPLICVLIQMIGIIIAWNSELIGALIILIGYGILGYTTSNFFLSPSFPLAVIACLFFFIVALGKRHVENIYQQL